MVVHGTVAYDDTMGATRGGVLIIRASITTWLGEELVSDR